MKELARLLGFGLALLLAVGGVALADDPDPEPAEPDVKIDSVVYGGSGCPQDSAEVTIADDGQSVEVIFNSFAAVAGREIPITQSRKNCILNISATVKEGFTWGVGRVDSRGLAGIPANGSGTHNALYFFQGQAGQVTTSHAFPARFQGPWQHTDEFTAENALFAPCGVDRSLNINASLRVSAGPGAREAAFAVMRAERVGRLLVKRCPN